MIHGRGNQEDCEHDSPGKLAESREQRLAALLSLEDKIDEAIRDNKI